MLIQCLRIQSGLDTAKLSGMMSRGLYMCKLFKQQGQAEHGCSNTVELAEGAHVQYRMKPIDSPMMMPMTAGIGMELTGKPALTPAMKTTASRPSLSVVVKARTQIPHLPDLAFNCMIMAKTKRQKLVEGCMCSKPFMVLSHSMLLCCECPS